MRYVGHWTVLGFGYWVVREKASGRFVGEVGFADFRRELTPSNESPTDGEPQTYRPLEGAPEIGWVLAPWAHGKGFATEAARAAIDWCETRFGAVRTVCVVNPENALSIRVAEKCGYREWARASYKGAPTILFERLSRSSM